MKKTTKNAQNSTKNVKNAQNAQNKCGGKGCGKNAKDCS